jgi:hypothetical protein
MTTETAAGKDWLHILIEVQMPRDASFLMVAGRGYSECETKHDHSDAGVGGSAKLWNKLFEVIRKRETSAE